MVLIYHAIACIIKIEEYNGSMGNMEKEVKRKGRNALIQKIILGTVATAGILTVAALAPNVLQLLKPYIKNKKSLTNKTYYVNQSRKRLVEKGLLVYDKNGYLKLTVAGERTLAEFEKHSFKLVKPKRWDGKWRMLIFDIKEERRSTRDKVRSTLMTIGFVRLQDSVWVYPFDCEDLVTLLKADFEIGQDLLYLIVERIENDKEIRKSFGLA